MGAFGIADSTRRTRRPSLQHDIRAIVNGILHVTLTGVPWEYLPHDSPSWLSVYAYHRQWLDGGVWKALNNTLRSQACMEE
ncbi:MAG: transposase [Dehalococcoidia bacterium]